MALPTPASYAVPGRRESGLAPAAAKDFAGCS
eukprot:COSAG01_NODE_31678_length_593_cov_0.880567_1_plen_31_part_01